MKVILLNILIISIKFFFWKWFY